MLRTIRDVIGQSQSASDDLPFDWIEVVRLASCLLTTASTLRFGVSLNSRLFAAPRTSKFPAMSTVWLGLE